MSIQCVDITYTENINTISNILCIQNDLLRWQFASPRLALPDPAQPRPVPPMLDEKYAM